MFIAVWCECLSKWVQRLRQKTPENKRSRPWPLFRSPVQVLGWSTKKTTSGADIISLAFELFTGQDHRTMPTDLDWTLQVSNCGLHPWFSRVFCMPPLFLVRLVTRNTVNILYLNRKHSQYCFSVLLFNNEKKNNRHFVLIWNVFSCEALSHHAEEGKLSRVNELACDFFF